MRLRIALASLVLVGCGDNRISTPDAAPSEPDARPAVCGDLEVQAGEDCDDGNHTKDLICDEDCRFTCGNGTADTDVGEACDTAITAGLGACPTTCDDLDACTADVLSGSACTTACLHSAITAAVDGDGCCPAGANANTDDDCTAMCGNGEFESGELCDTGITAGAGACPTTCNDQQACTTDTLVSANTCQARCVATPITTPANNDGCCPAANGANATNDNDCSPTCGNGVREGNETCDTAIAAGPNACPTTCDDDVACTTNVLSNPGTCTAACSFPAITMPIHNDGCCPPGANATNDNNCQPVCRNGVVEGTEQCDDGNNVDTDACKNDCTPGTPPTAFRFDTLALRDPHAFTQVFIFCADITGQLNDQFTANIDNDEDDDGFRDLSPTVVFRPLTQAATASTPAAIHFAACTDATPMMCSPGSAPAIPVTATNQSTGTCLGPIANTTRGLYSPPVTSATAPCFATNEADVTINLGGVMIPLTDARVGATYVGNPAGTLTNGLLRGFITEAAANNVILPMDLAVVGGKRLSELLAGGMGNCQSFSDKDTHEGAPGWWFYLNFGATRRSWTDN